MKTMTCPKCEGTKFIQGFGHIANGICFRCNGAGVVAFRKAAPPKPMNQSAIDFCERVIAITEAELEVMSYGELLKMRDGCHWHYPQYPNLLAIWLEKGDKHFFAAQEERLACC